MLSFARRWYRSIYPGKLHALAGRHQGIYMRRETLIVARELASITAGWIVLSEFICVHLWFHELFFGHIISRSLQRGSKFSSAYSQFN
jgi:hypothetical protein